MPETYRTADGWGRGVGAPVGIRSDRPRRGGLITPYSIVKPGAIDHLGIEAKRLGFKRPLVLASKRFFGEGNTEEDICNRELWNRLRIDLELNHANPLKYTVELGGEKEGTVAAAREVSGAIINNNCDSVIVIGGGSLIDIAKAAALGVENGGVLECEGTAKTTRYALPMIIAPTTAGTGSEATFVSVLLGEDDKGNPRKVVFYSMHMLHPDTISLVDASLTVSMGSKLTRDTAMDALSHAIESLASPNASKLSAEEAKQAVIMIMKYLPIAYKYARYHDALKGHRENVSQIDADEAQARSMLAEAAHRAGIALANSGPIFLRRLGDEGKVVPVTDQNVRLVDFPDTMNCIISGAGITHMVGLVTGSIFGMEHGEAVGMVLTHAIEVLKIHSPERLAELADAIGLPAEPQAFIDAVKRLAEEVDVRETLPEEARKSFDAIVSSAWQNGGHRLSHNINGGVSRSEITEVVIAMLPA